MEATIKCTLKELKEEKKEREKHFKKLSETKTRILEVLIRNRGLSKEFVKQVVEMLRKTRSKVRIKDKSGKSFWNNVRQACLLSLEPHTLQFIASRYKGANK